jgi:hypothetical protein
MNTDKLKSKASIELLRRKSTDYLFQPIASADNQRKPPSPFQTGLRYLKLLGQLKRQNDTNQIKSSRLERTSAFSTNYYAPLPPLSNHLNNKSIQVDDLDEISYKTAINNNSSYLSLYELLFIFLSILFFVLIILFMQVYSYPIHCVLHKKFWYPFDFSNGFLCENTNIEIHYFEIYSTIYQVEMQRNLKSMNCLGFDILSCLPIDYFLIPKGQIIRRNDQLNKYCNHTQKINCQNNSLSILPYEYKWNLKNNQFNPLFHCSCLTSSTNIKCFHFMIHDQCELQIPWFDYCVKYSTTQSTCQAFIKTL